MIAAEASIPDIPHPDADPEGFAAAIEAVGILRGLKFFAVLSEAANADVFIAPIDADPVIARMQIGGIEHPHTMLNTELRDAVRVCAGVIEIAGRSRDQALMIEGVRDGLAVVRAMDSRPMVIDRLCAVSSARLMLDVVRDQLVQGRWSGGACGAMLSEIDRRLPLPSPLEVFEADGAYTLCMIEWLYATNRPEIALRDGMASASSMMDVLEAVWDAFDFDQVFGEPEDRWPPRAAAIESFARYRASIIENASRPRLERTPIEQPVAILWTALDYFASSVPQQMIDHHDEHVALVHGIRVMLALEVYAARHGEYPEALEALTPLVLPVVPADPFANDGRFRYRRAAANRAEQAPTYILYSVGADGQDNNGAASTDWNRGAMIGKCADCDFVFTLPEPPESDE